MARKASARRGSFRIIGGQWRGRRLEFVDDGTVRPSTDRVRETLFNWAAPFVRGARCLDLFSGSGALGLEALSRGAAEVVFVDTQPAVIRRIRQHLAQLEATAQVHQGDALSYLNQPGPAFDLVFLDPPFRQGLLPSVLAVLTGHLAPGSRIYLEAEKGLDLEIPAGYEILKRKIAGQVGYHWLAYAAPETDISS